MMQYKERKKKGLGINELSAWAGYHKDCKIYLEDDVFLCSCFFSFFLGYLGMALLIVKRKRWVPCVID